MNSTNLSEITNPSIASLPAPLRAGQDLAELLELPLSEFNLYRVDFTLQCPASGGLWVVDFYDEAGERNYADNYAAVYPTSGDGAEQQTAFFMARAGAVRATLGVRSQGDPIDVLKVSVTTATKDETLEWMDSFLADFPDIAPSLRLDEKRWEVLPRTAEKLRQGETLRVVALGDSISNDLMNGLGHLLVEREHPGAEMRIIHANGPEKSCENYQREEVLQRLVVPHSPDLLTVGGMSHEPEDVRTVIRNVRRLCGDVEALYFDVAVNGDQECEKRLADLRKLQRFGAEDGFAVCDITTPYHDCIRRAEHSHEWFSRDDQHANDRGKQLLGRIFAACFRF